MDNTTRAAIHAIHLEVPKFIIRDSSKHQSEQGAADNIYWIVNTLIDCFDKKKRPPTSLLYALGDLKKVADLVQEAAKLSKENPDDDETYECHKALRKQAQDALLECFGLLTVRGAPSKNRQEIIVTMAEFLCPPIDDEGEPTGVPKCGSITAAAKSTEEVLGLSYKTAGRVWKEYEKAFNFM